MRHSTVPEKKTQHIQRREDAGGSRKRQVFLARHQRLFRLPYYQQAQEMFNEALNDETCSDRCFTDICHRLNVSSQVTAALHEGIRAGVRNRAGR